MVIQKILFPQIGRCTEQQMYFRAAAEKTERKKKKKKKRKNNGLSESNIPYHYSEHKLRLKKGEPVRFDTYFNGFSIDKWKKYTCLDQLSLRLHLQGIVKVTLISRHLLHENMIEKILSEAIVDAGSGKEFSFPFDLKDAKGMLAFELEALSEQGIVYDGAYCSTIEKERIRNVKIGLGICTFRREEYVEKNLRILQDEIIHNTDCALHGHLEVFISDNAKSLDTKRLQTEQVHIYPNRNYGGTGGFTRCLIEMKRNEKKSAITHALLMDDDVVIEPQALEKTYLLLALLKEEYLDAFIGGAMLRLDQQFIQHESGAVLYTDTGFLSSLKNGLDLRSGENCLYNEIEEHSDYNAWWYCCFPLRVASDENLPFPFFIKVDDIEYSLRNMKHLILMNGICVWHEPFENKYSSNLEYYNVRNRLILCAWYGSGYGLKTVIRQMLSFCLREITYYRYKNVDLYLRGVRDFLKGPRWLMRQDAEALNQELIQAGYQAQDPDTLDMGFSYPVYEASREDYGQGSSRKKRILTLNGLLLPARGDNIAPMASVRGVHFYRRRRVMNYEITSNRAFITERSVPQIMQSLYKVLRTIIVVIGNYEKANKAYQMEGKRLMTLKFWKRYLNIK